MRSAKAQPLPQQVDYLDAMTFPAGGAIPKGRELVIVTTFTEQHLSSREIEDQTKVPYLQRKVALWEALRSVTGSCFYAWAQLTEPRVDVFAKQAGEIRARFAKEIDQLVLTALTNPMDLKGIARTAQLGINARRTLDICLEALLGYPSQKSVGPDVARTVVEIDWALAGIAKWTQAYPYAFESDLKIDFAKNGSFYSTDKNTRKDITAKQIANIFLVRESVIDTLEERAIRQLRKNFRHSDALKEFALDFLADV